MRVEGEDGVGALDHRLVAEVDAVEGPDRDRARARLGVRQGCDLDAHRSASATAGTSSATRSTASSAARLLDPERADRGAAQVRAVGVAEGLDQGADVGPGRALDLVVGEPAVAGEQLGAVDLDVAQRRLHHLAAVGLAVEALAADPHRRGHRHALAHGPGRQLQRLRKLAGLGQLAVGVAGAGAPAEPGRRQVGLRQADEEALQAGRRGRAGSAAGRSRRGRGCRRGRLCSRARAGPRATTSCEVTPAGLS